MIEKISLNKRERFKRLAVTRTNEVLKKIRVLGNCSNRSAYEYTEEEIMEEIKKCVVVCSNCHRKIHWVEKNARNRPIKQPVV